MYPALVNCTTIIYFSEWPSEALIDVAYYFLTKFDFQLENNEIVKILFIKLNVRVWYLDSSDIGESLFVYSSFNQNISDSNER
jgi:hypothetical protein